MKKSIKKALPKWATTVTPLSKLIALLLFTALPFIGFYAGMQYQKDLTPAESSISASPSPQPTSIPKGSCITDNDCPIIGGAGTACPDGENCNLPVVRAQCVHGYCDL